MCTSNVRILYLELKSVRKKIKVAILARRKLRSCDIERESCVQADLKGAVSRYFSIFLKYQIFLVLK